MTHRIKQLLKEKGQTQASLAEAIGAHTITVHKILSGKMGLTEEYLVKISMALNVPIEELFIKPSNTRPVAVKAHVQAGDWTESWQWDESSFYDVAVPVDPELVKHNLYAAETRGPSMNKRYPEGSVLVFTDIIETGEAIEEGRRYVVERQRTDGDLEVTVKTLWKDEEGHSWLIPESDDPRFQTPIGINGGAEGETIRIMGRVRYAVLKE